MALSPAQVAGGLSRPGSFELWDWTHHSAVGSAAQHCREQRERPPGVCRDLQVADRLHLAPSLFGDDIADDSIDAAVAVLQSMSVVLVLEEAPKDQSQLDLFKLTMGFETGDLGSDDHHMRDASAEGLEAAKGRLKKKEEALHPLLQIADWERLPERKEEILKAVAVLLVEPKVEAIPCSPLVHVNYSQALLDLLKEKSTATVALGKGFQQQAFIVKAGKKFRATRYFVGERIKAHWKKTSGPIYNARVQGINSDGSPAGFPRPL